MIRHMAKNHDPHPLQATSNERDFWVVHVANVAQMASAARFSQMLITATGHMALMTTLHPETISRFKQRLAIRPTRDPLKKFRDALQVRAVGELVNAIPPHMRAPHTQKPCSCGILIARAPYYRMIYPGLCNQRHSFSQIKRLML